MCRSLLLLALGFPMLAAAMPIRTRMIRPRAYFVEAENNLLEALDLKSKRLTFGRRDFDQCGLRLVREALTLTYSCTLPIPSRARVSRLQKIETPTEMTVNFGGTKRQVRLVVAEDAKSLTLSTSFDKTGIDFEVSKFNDDFFSVYNKVAQLVISEALKKPIQLDVLESR